MEGSRQSRGLIAEFNHNDMNLYFTTNKSTMYTSYYDKVWELL